jgi:hypothetical protein
VALTTYRHLALTLRMSEAVLLFPLVWLYSVLGDLNLYPSFSVRALAHTPAKPEQGPIPSPDAM